MHGMRPLEFYNMKLEKMSFEEKLHYFDTALVVIGQYGAGLVNSIFMRSKAIIIELHDGEGREFQEISRIAQLDFFRYKTNSNHAKIDIKDFTNWLSQHAVFSKYFDLCNSNATSNLPQTSKEFKLLE